MGIKNIRVEFPSTEKLENSVSVISERLFSDNAVVQAQKVINGEQIKKNSAIIKTAENTQQIDKKVKAIGSELHSERCERIDADEENKIALTKIQNRLELYIKIHKWDTLKSILIGIISAFIGVIFTVIATKCGWL